MLSVESGLVNEGDDGKREDEFKVSTSNTQIVSAVNVLRHFFRSMAYIGLTWNGFEFINFFLPPTSHSNKNRSTLSDVPLVRLSGMTITRP